MDVAETDLVQSGWGADSRGDPYYGPDSLREIVNQLGSGAMAVPKEVAASCELVLLAVPWDNVPGTLASLPGWNNQILIDGTNPFHGKAGKFTPAAVGNLSTSNEEAKKQVESSSKSLATPSLILETFAMEV